MDPRRCGIYLRISRDDAEVKGLGVARQSEDCQALARARSWVIVDVYTDNDVSAFSGRRRPAYEQLLDDLRSGRIDAVVAWHPDRLHRSPRELEGFIDVVEQAGAAVATVQAGELDLSNAAGRMTARVVGAVARHESEQKSERQKSKARELAAAGKFNGGGWRPYGFDDDAVTIRESEADVIRKVARSVLAGATVRGSAAALTRDGHLTTTGKAWTPTSLRRILVSPRIAGLRSSKGEVVADAVWPAIIDREQHEALVRLLTDPSRNRRGITSRSYLLTGIARCALCDAKLVARPRSDKRRCMVCATGPGFKGCGKIRTLAEPMEELITEAVLLRSDGPELAAALLESNAPSGSPVGDEIRALGRRLDDLAEMWAAGELDRRSWLAAKETVDRLLADAKARAARLGSDRLLIEALGARGGLREAWPDLSIDEQRSVVGSVITRVTVAPAVRGNNRFQAERFDILWAV